MPADTGYLWDRLVGVAACPGHGSMVSWPDAEPRRVEWSDVVRDAERMTAGLRTAGVRPGARVASVLINTPETVRGVLATWLAGGALASLPVPARGMDAGEYAEQLAVMCRRLRPEVFVVAAQTLAALPEAVVAKFGIRTWESMVDTGRVEASPPGDDEVAFIQYSSGSTSTPKGCMLTPRAIAAQLDLLGHMVDGRPGHDRVMSWLPLSHDMGMFGGLLTPWFNGWDLYLSSPERFAMSPRTWFGDLARYGGTITTGPTSGLHLAARAWGTRNLSAGDLTRMRVCIVGAERVDWDTLQVAHGVFSRFGMREEVFMPAYGLAESVLAVTATPVDEKPRYVPVDGVALADGEIRHVADDDPTATRVVSAGVPVRGASLPGLDATLGEVRIASASLSTGYWADPERTAASFVDGTFHTNDLGFVADGHFYPVGRSDDMLSIAGRKVYAREVEQAVDRLDGVRTGCSTLIGGEDGLTLCLEVKPSVTDYKELAAIAADVAMAKAAVVLDRCVFLDRNTVPKTPSGKIQRHRCRHLLASGRFAPLAVVDLS